MDYESPSVRTVPNQLEYQTCVPTAYEIFDVGYDDDESSDHVDYWCKAYRHSKHSRIHDVSSSVGLALAQHSG